MTLYLTGAPTHDGDTADYADYPTWLPNPESNNVALEPPPQMVSPTELVSHPSPYDLVKCSNYHGWTAGASVAPTTIAPLEESTILPDPVTHPVNSEGVCSTSLLEETVDPSLWYSEPPALDQFTQQTYSSLSNLHGCASNPPISAPSLALPDGDEMGEEADGEENPTALEDRPISVTMSSSYNDTGGARTDSEMNKGTCSGNGGGNAGVHDADDHRHPRPRPHSRRGVLHQGRQRLHNDVERKYRATIGHAIATLRSVLPPPRLPRRKSGYIKPTKAEVIGEAAAYIRTLEGDRAALQAEMGNVLFLLSAYRKVLRMKGDEGNGQCAGLDENRKVVPISC